MTNGKLQKDYWFGQLDEFLDDLRQRARRLPNKDELHQLVLQYHAMKKTYPDLIVKVVLTSPSFTEDNRHIVYRAPEDFTFKFPGVQK